MFRHEAMTGREDHARPFLLLVIALLAVLAPTPAWAMRGWYVDNTNPASSDTGPGTKTKPYRTITAALAAHRDTGVTIIVGGGPYRERVQIDANGTANSPIVVRTDGSAVVIDGADDFSQSGQWADFDGDVWLASGVNWSPVVVFADGARLTSSTASPSNLQPGEWTWVAGGGLYANVGGGSPAAHAAAVGRRPTGFLVNGRSHIFIDGFTVQRMQDKGVELIGVSSVIVKNNVIHQCGSSAIGVRSNSDHVQVYANTVSDNNHHGIEFRDGVTSSLIDNNESFSNHHVGDSWATGIYLAGSPNNRIENNRLHDNQDSGCEVQTGSNNCLVRQNMSWSNGDHGFAQLYATGTLLLNDVAWGNHTDAISIEGGSTGTLVYNCISVCSSPAPKSYCVFVDSTSTAGFNADYNVFWNLSGQSPVRYNNVTYANTAAFLAATHIGPNSFGADPRFVDAPNGDFHLDPDSPAIDDATTSIPGWDELDAEGYMRIDNPGTPNAGAGPLNYADRGALEFQTAGVLAVGDAPGASFALSAAFPNPTRQAVAFTLRLGAAAEVSFSVFDVAGREVWSERTVLPSGATTLRWPLTGASGARVPNGLYLARVERRGGDTATARFVVTR